MSRPILTVVTQKELHSFRIGKGYYRVGRN